MADATLPSYKPGHVPFWGRLNNALRKPSRIVSIVSVDDELITVVDRGTTERLWTHPPAATAIALALIRGPLQLSRFGEDVFIVDGHPLSLVHPAQASPCPDPGGCGHGRVISVETGEPWQIEDTLALQKSPEEG